MDFGDRSEDRNESWETVMDVGDHNGRWTTVADGWKSVMGNVVDGENGKTADR